MLTYPRGSKKPNTLSQSGRASVLFSITVFVGIALLVPFDIYDVDTFWHVANGRAMIEAGHVVNEEVFSFTSQGNRFSNHEWLAQVLFFLAFLAGGAAGLSAVKVFLSLCISFVLFRSARQLGAGSVVASLICLFFVFAVLGRFVIRPQLFSMLGLSLLGFILYGYRAEKLGKGALFFLPFIMVFWDFLHGAVYGGLLFGVFMVGEGIKVYFRMSGKRWCASPPMAADRFRLLLRWSIISLFAMLINPYGIFSYDIFFEFVSGNTMVSVTNEFLMTPWKGREAFWLFLGGVFLSLFVSSRTRDLTNILLFFPFAYLAVRYVRGAEAFGPTMIPILGFNLSRLLEKVRDTRTVQFCFLAVGAASLLFVVYYKFFAPKHQYSFGYTINENYLPGGSARFVKEAGLEGNLFNSGKFGGYLSYFLFPDYKIYHYMHHILFDITNLDVTSPGVWERWKRKNWDITFAIAGNEKEITMFSSNGFVPVYKEEAATVLVKKEGRNQKVLDLFEIKHFDPFWSKAKFRSLASDETVYPDLMREMSTYLTYRADSFVADIFGELILSENSVLSADKKLALIEHAQKFNQRNSWLKAAEGMLYYRKKNMDRARIALSEAVRLKKGFVWAKLNLAYVLYDLGRFGEAADTFGQILETNPTSAEALYGSALAHFRLNMSSLARAEWEKYLKLAPQGKWSKKAREFLKKIK